MSPAGRQKERAAEASKGTPGARSPLLPIVRALGSGLGSTGNSRRQPKHPCCTGQGRMPAVQEKRLSALRFLGRGSYTVERVKTTKQRGSITETGQWGEGGNWSGDSCVPQSSSPSPTCALHTHLSQVAWSRWPTVHCASGGPG